MLAASLADFLKEYADGLERGDFEIGDEGLRSPEAGQPDPSRWGLPPYLAGEASEPASADPGAATADEDGAGAQGEVVLEGRMGVLMGGPETMFTLETADGRERSFLAKPDLTRGYAAIAVRQRARVRARPYSSDVSSVFVDQAGSEAPEFVAIEYTLLR